MMKAKCILGLSIFVFSSSHALNPTSWSSHRVRANSNSTWNGVTQAVVKDAVDAMNSGYYNWTDGRWDSIDAWWLTGNALQCVLDYTAQTGDKQYLSQAENTVEKQKAPLPWWPQGGGYFRADSTDDTGWWALALVRLWDITGDDEYLEIAKMDEEYMFQYWNSSTCGGGIIWNVPTLSYKNAISNELYITLAASLHNRQPGDTLYLSRAVKVWQWFQGSGMINSQNLVNDGLMDGSNGTCVNNRATVWTYNQGVILGGLSELFNATKEGQYLEVARRIADAVVSSQTLSPGGILTESCDDAASCDHDQSAFKGIFARHLAALDALLADRPYQSYLASNAKSAWTFDRNSSNFYGLKWKGPFDNLTIGTQTSAVSQLVANL